MQAIESEHQAKMGELERDLLETRMKLRKEAEAKIKSMESAAHEKAAKYLSDHTASLESENNELEQQLKVISRNTQELIRRKENLERENRELEQEQRIRDDLVRLRIEKVQNVQQRDKKKKILMRKEAARQTKHTVINSLQQRGLQYLGSSTSASSTFEVNRHQGKHNTTNELAVTPRVAHAKDQNAQQPKPNETLMPIGKQSSSWFDDDDDDEYGE